jgi:hypothetical protein
MGRACTRMGKKTNEYRVLARKTEEERRLGRHRRRWEDNIVTYRSIAKQRLGKHIPAEANARNSRTSITRQRSSKHASLTIGAVFSACSVRNDYKEEFRSWPESVVVELVFVENWVQFWRWQSKVIEKK